MLPFAVPFQLSVAVSRFVFFSTLILIGFSDWLINELDPAKNALFWAAGTFGAFAIRLALPKMPWKRSLSGWLLGTLFAFFIAPSAVDWGWLNVVLSKPVSVWFFAGMMGDALILLIGWSRTEAAKNPAQAVDVTISISKKIYNAFGSGEGIAAFFLDLLKGFKKNNDKPTDKSNES